MDFLNEFGIILFLPASPIRLNHEIYESNIIFMITNENKILKKHCFLTTR